MAPWTQVCNELLPLSRGRWGMAQASMQMEQRMAQRVALKLGMLR